MNDLVAKTVFGETTLEDVVKHFFDKIESFHIYCEDAGIDLYSHSFDMDEEHLRFYGPDEIDFEFELNKKVKIKENEFEFEDNEQTFILTMFQKINLNSFLP